MYWKRSACKLTCISAYERRADVIGSASAGNEQQLVRCDHFHMFLEMLTLASRCGGQNYEFLATKSYYNNVDKENCS